MRALPRFLPVLILLVAAPASAQAAFTNRQVAIGAEGFAARAVAPGAPAAYGGGASVVVNRVGGHASYGTGGGTTLSIGADYYLNRDGRSERPGTVAVGATFSRLSLGEYYDNVFLFSPGVRLAGRLVESHTILLVPQVAFGLTIPSSSSVYNGYRRVQFERQATAAAGLSLGVGDRDLRTVLTPGVSYSMPMGAGDGAFAFTLSAGFAIGGGH